MRANSILSDKGDFVLDFIARPDTITTNGWF